MGEALLIALKDARERMRDRSAILVAVVVPFALAALFSLALSGVSGGSVRFVYGFVDEDGGAQARLLENRILKPLAAGGVISLRTVRDRAEARRLADAGTIDAAIVVPDGFSRTVTGGRSAQLLVIGDVDSPTGTGVARAIARSYAGEVTSVRLAVATAVVASGRGTPPSARLAVLGARAASTPAPIALADVSARERELDPTTFYSAGMAIFFLFFTVQFGVSSLLDERRQGTMARLLVAPIRRGAVLAGKLLTGVALGLVSMTVLVVTTSLLIGADWGSPGGVLLLVTAGVLAATGITALVASFARTPEQAGYIQAIVALVLGMLGGSFFPVAQAGGVVERLSLVTPHAWFLRGLGDMANGGGVSDAALPALAILAFGAACGVVALLRIDRLVRP